MRLGSDDPRVRHSGEPGVRRTRPSERTRRPKNPASERTRRVERTRLRTNPAVERTRPSNEPGVRTNPRVRTNPTSERTRRRTNPAVRTNPASERTRRPNEPGVRTNPASERTRRPNEPGVRTNPAPARPAQRDDGEAVPLREAFGRLAAVPPRHVVGLEMRRRGGQHDRRGRRHRPPHRRDRLGLRRSAPERQLRAGRAGDRCGGPAGDRGADSRGAARRLPAQRAQPAVQAIVLHLPVRRRRDDPCRLSRQRAGTLPQPVRPDAWAEGGAARGARGLWRADAARAGRPGAGWCGWPAGALQERRLHQRDPARRQGPGAVRGDDRLRDDHGARDRRRVARRHRRAFRTRSPQSASSAHGRAVRAHLRRRSTAGPVPPDRCRPAGSRRRSRWSWRRRR